MRSTLLPPLLFLSSACAAAPPPSANGSDDAAVAPASSVGASAAPTPKLKPVAATASASPPSMPVRRDADAPTIADPIERTAYERVAGVFAEHCRRCHAEGTRLSSWEAMKGVDMNAYPFGGGTKAEVAKRIRRSIGLDGATATMPKGYGRALSKDDVDRIVAWSESVK